MPYQETRLRVFQELVECCHTLYLWTYDRNMELVESSCPEELLLTGLITPSSHWDEILENIHRHRKPFVMSNDLGLMWITAASMNKDEIERIHVLGPFFMYEVSAAQIEAELRRRNLLTNLMKPTLQFVRNLPVIPFTRVLEYGIMLHYCISGEKLAFDEIRFQQDSSDALPELELGNIHGTYENEKELLRLVREGDLNFKSHAQRMANTGRIGNIGDGQAIRQLKNMILVSTTLISRAAMEGGLPPETAYTVADRYFQAIEKSHSIQSIIDINAAMQDDFVQRVHQIRQNESLSKPIRVCLEQMRTRMEEDISLEQLAKEFGYSTYYLSRKFRSETGQTFKDHLRQLRLERAKFLLRNTDETVLTISERLQFCSQSYFSDTFRKAFGVSPTDYRDQLDS